MADKKKLFSGIEIGTQLSAIIQGSKRKDI